jgi:hypothetical protein
MVLTFIRYNVTQMNRSSCALGLFLAGCMVAIPLSAAAPPPCDPDNGGITLPPGFCALVAIDGLGAARHIAVAPNGDVYVALQAGGVEAAGWSPCAIPRATATST